MRKWEVDLTLIETWMDSLNDEEYEHLVAALEYLEEHGPTTGDRSLTLSKAPSTRT